QQRLEVSERPFGPADASGGDALTDRRRIVRTVDRELVAARPSRREPRLDAADAERERSERAPRTERDAVGHDVITRRRRGPGSPGRGRDAVPELPALIDADRVLGEVDRYDDAGRLVLEAVERDPPEGPRIHIGELHLAPVSVRARVLDPDRDRHVVVLRARRDDP